MLIDEPRSTDCICAVCSATVQTDSVEVLFMDSFAGGSPLTLCWCSHVAITA